VATLTNKLYHSKSTVIQYRNTSLVCYVKYTAAFYTNVIMQWWWSVFISCRSDAEPQLSPLANSDIGSHCVTLQKKQWNCIFIL